jgi:two-component system, OmpR family, sensor histidine kinase KdpD
LTRRILRVLASLAAVGAVTFVGFRLLPVNATTIAFAYLMLVLLLASTWGFFEAALVSFVATLTFNYYFLPPVGTFTIRDPQNFVAFLCFFTTSLIAGRLSYTAKRRALDAVERQNDVERLYTFSRAILLIDGGAPFGKQLIEKLAETFSLRAAVLYDRRAAAFYRAGPAEFEGLDDQLREAAMNNASYSDPGRRRLITAIRLGSEPIASLGLDSPVMPDSVLQGIANLIAIGLERARAQALAHELEAARRSEQLRTTLIDAMAHELKTPLTSIRAATTALLGGPGASAETRAELLGIADQEARHLGDLIDDSIEMARLDTSHIEIHRELVRIEDIVLEVVNSLEGEIDDRPLSISSNPELPPVPADRRLVRLAIKQVVDNAIKYSPPQQPVAIAMKLAPDAIAVEVTDHGSGISAAEQARIFERFYRSPLVKEQIPGSGLGLSIAYSIAQAHRGDLTVASRPGETTFRLVLPLDQKGEESSERGTHSGGG